jgi:hypothetical protein
MVAANGSGGWQAAAGVETKTESGPEYTPAIELEVRARALHPAQLEVLDQAPPKYQNLVRQAFEGASSPRKAIQACGLTCTHYDIAEVRACTVWRCPLHRFRPYQGGA